MGCGKDTWKKTVILILLLFSISKADILQCQDIKDCLPEDIIEEDFLFQKQYRYGLDLIKHRINSVEISEGIFVYENCKVREGIASWYGERFHGRRTSSGEPFLLYRFTAASRELPLGTYVLVRNVENNRIVVVKINDRGPYVKGRILDLSKAAARELGMVRKGLARVQIIPLKCLTPDTAHRLNEKIIGDIVKSRYR